MIVFYCRFILYFKYILSIQALCIVSFLRFSHMCWSAMD